jgi:hypothetical protein
LISGFRRDADEICALLGYNATSVKYYHSTLRYTLEERRSQIAQIVKYLINMLSSPVLFPVC